MKEELTPCSKCGCMTKSIRLGRAHYVCGKCKHDKTLSDLYFYEATHHEQIKNRSGEQKTKKSNKTK
jgi:hypothetical protein